MGLVSSQQQQELLDRLRSAGGLLPEGMEGLVSLAAKQAAKEEELATLRSQVILLQCTTCCVEAVCSRSKGLWILQVFVKEGAGIAPKDSMYETDTATHPRTVTAVVCA